MRKEFYDGDKLVSLKKDFLGWKVIYPIRNPDGSINHKNLWIGGSWFNLVKWGLIVFCLLLLTLSYYHDTKACSEVANYVAENPCVWCETVMKVREYNDAKFEINYSLLQEWMVNDS